MAKVFLITGFENWGKTFLINGLFDRQRFYQGSLYPFAGKEFCVQPQSNDDLGEDGYVRGIRNRRSKLSQAGLSADLVISAFCPTKEPGNDSIRIIRTLYPSDQVHVNAIEYKWCLHAKLQLNHIMSHYAQEKNVIVHTLSEQDAAKKLSELRGILTTLL